MCMILPRVFFALGFASVFQGVQAAEKQVSPAANEPPVLLLSQPLALQPGVTNKLSIRGLRLKGVTNIQFTGLSAPLEGKLGKIEDSKVPDGASAKSAGDQQVEVDVLLPENAPLGTNVTVLATSLAGTSKALPLLVIAAASLLEEKEPNGGFKEAQELQSGQTVRGSLGDGADVDVFKIAGRAGQMLRAEVIAARLNSTLDSALTLYDAKGMILGSNDDGAGRDSILTQKLPADGAYFLVLTSVNEKPAKTHLYALKLTLEP